MTYRTVGTTDGLEAAVRAGHTEIMIHRDDDRAVDVYWTGLSKVMVTGHTRVRAHQASLVRAYGHAEVEAFDTAHVIAKGRSRVYAHGFSHVVAHEQSTVTLFGYDATATPVGHDCTIERICEDSRIAA